LKLLHLHSNGSDPLAPGIGYIPSDCIRIAFFIKCILFKDFITSVEVLREIFAMYNRNGQRSP